MRTDAVKGVKKVLLRPLGGLIAVNA